MPAHVQVQDISAVGGQNITRKRHEPRIRCGNSKDRLYIVCNKWVQGKTETCGQHRQEVNLAPFKPVFLKLFRLRTGLANISEGACPNFG